MKTFLYRFFIFLTNHKASSMMLMKFSQSKLSRAIIPSYDKLYKLNWEEVERNRSDFETLHDLFTRQLKEGARQINQETNTVVSPVDAVYEDYGDIQSDRNILVKGKVYSIQEMLGDNAALEKYIGGKYMILYLSPSHYHRIHSPVDGEVVKRWSLGKLSYPVNKLGLKYGKSTLSKNFRVITEIKHAFGYLSVVKVGAMFVNSIEITNDSDKLQKGEELAYFSFGSTVVLLFEKNTFEINEELQASSQVKYGEVLGFLK
ncbi:phosphatidylserine decarboxylase [Bacillus massiliigorillae]|uniref:phosphatidylserine decarboxylase n=1 Tax=Bacillus massiliigorillae TaxID=1243664 RepID=UPI0012B53547|nr:phosphatidylserine decarboxylase [Bacillus massiliigorillae]